MPQLTRKRVNDRPATWHVHYAGVRVGVIVERSGIGSRRRTMARWVNKHDSDNLKSMNHRGIEYTIVQGIGRDTWRWTVLLGNNIYKSGQAMGKPEAVGNATR